jgi:bifunctional aspartokinase / homoserine dehydrogenase 1
MANVTRPLRVVKFGGTSVGDAPRIRKVVEIVRDAARESELVVVVSAMSGVTNKLVEAAAHSEAGNREAVERIFEELRERHRAVVGALIHSAPVRNRIQHEVEQVFQEGERLCQGTVLLRELTLRARDSISSLGERLSAPIVAAALAECGVEFGIKSEAIEATELVVTDSCHGAADPLTNLTRERCEARLRPLLREGVIPVVTGFIGATVDGMLTTLGRGGSDYSATILGAALHADEVIIWTDVDGLMTADPRLVPGAATIAEISYREAAELAHFGAKVLHPKTISALITVGGPGIVGVPDVLGRTFATTAAVRANVLLISQSSSQNDICLVVASSAAERTVEALRREFEQDLAHEKVEHITLDQTMAIVTVVGRNLRGCGTVGRTFAALGRENVNVVAIAQGSSGSNISFVVSKQDVKAALETTHREFQLGTPESLTLPVKRVGVSPAAWQYESEQRTASAD